MIKFRIWSILLIGMVSCTEQVTPSSYLYTQVFTGEKSKTWKLKFMEQTLNGKAEAFNEPCASDDEFVFYANSERAFKATTGSTKCYSDEAEIINDSWSFNSATATLTMVFPLLTESSLPFIVREAKISSNWNILLTRAIQKVIAFILSQRKINQR